jgi:hypothetical protein
VISTNNYPPFLNSPMISMGAFSLPQLNSNSVGMVRTVSSLLLALFLTF